MNKQVLTSHNTFTTIFTNRSKFNIIQNKNIRKLRFCALRQLVQKPNMMQPARARKLQQTINA